MANIIQDAKSNLYADDAAITVNGKDSVEIENELNIQLLHISKWFVSNKLSLNYKKSNVMMFGIGPSFQEKALSVGPMDSQLDQVTQFKYLGVVLDPKLTFTKLKMLGKIRNIVDRDTAFSLYQSLVLPLLDYCDVVYDGLSQYNSDMLQKLQNAGIRSVLQCDSRSHITDIHSEVKLEYLCSRREKHTMVYHGLSLPYILSMFNKASDLHGINTRYAVTGNFELPKVRLETCQRSFRYCGVQAWYDVPTEWKALNTLPSFKKALKKY